MTLDCCCDDVKPKINYQKLVGEHRPPYDIFLSKRLLENEMEMEAKKNRNRCHKNTKAEIHLHCLPKCPQSEQHKIVLSCKKESKPACCPKPSCCPAKNNAEPSPAVLLTMDQKTCHYNPAVKCEHVQKKKKDYLYRCESRELRASNLYSYCLCIKRNGLQHECPRTPCQGRKACLIKPWPDCWPSGGCHGIDYDREKGLQRHNPTLEYRFDNKICEPPSRSDPLSPCHN